MDRRTLLRTAAVTPLAAAAGLATAAPAGAVPRFGTTLASGLNIPWGLDFLPDGSALCCMRNDGRLIRIQPSGGFSEVATLPSTRSGSEDGALGLAVSPQFATDRRVYAYYSTPSDNRVAWFTYEGGVLGSPNVILSGIPHGRIHNGGRLFFAANGSLFITCGESGNKPLAQNKASLGGKILRIDRDGNPWPTNPLIGTTGDDRIYSWGHRNPQGIDQASDGRMWACELGQDTWDELNQVAAGRNYGWPTVEGPDGPGGFFDPLVTWHPADCSPSGMAIRGGYAYIGALRGQSLWRVDIKGSGLRTKVRFFQNTFGRIRTVRLAPDDSLWITTANGSDKDRVIKIRFVAA
jgi:glucose/arabinose dehydrogenase